MTADDSEKYTNHENLVKSKEETKVGMFSASCTLENAEYKDEHISPDEKHRKNTRKSIEMRVAQEN